MTTEFNIPRDLVGVDSDVLAKEAVKRLAFRKADDVRLYDVRENTSITDYYINVTATSLTHVGALAEDIADNFEERGLRPLRTEGKRGTPWILVDFGSLIVNIFDAQSRRFYDFDRLLPPECERDVTDLCVAADEF